MNVKQEKRNPNFQLIKMVPAQKILNNIFPNNKQLLKAISSLYEAVNPLQKIGNVLQFAMKLKKPHSGPISGTFCSINPQKRTLLK